MSKNIIICGVGGQGTVLAAKVLSQAAISNGERVLSAETIGMFAVCGGVGSRDILVDWHLQSREDRIA